MRRAGGGHGAAGRVLSIHICASGLTQESFDVTSLDMARAGAIESAGTMMYGINTATTWLYGGVFTRFPGLKVTLAESGAAWVPALLDRLRYMAGHAGTTFRKAWRDPGLSPSEVLRNFWFCAFDDFSAIEARHRIGVDNILLEVDYPHSDSTWPDSQTHTKRLLAGVPDEDVRKITHGNAAALFRHLLPAA